MDAASERGLELVDKAGFSTRPARARAGAQALVQVLGVVRGKEGGPAGDEVEQRATLGQTVSAIFEMAARARPWPVTRRGAQPGAHWVSLDIARGEQVRLIQDAGREPPLPQIAPPALAEVDVVGVAPVGLAQAVRQPRSGLGHKDQVDVVGHQAPGPDRDPCGPGVLGEERLVEEVVVRAEEGRLAAIATLGDMVRQAGRNDAGETRHVRPLPNSPTVVNWVMCPLNRRMCPLNRRRVPSAQGREHRV